jgi:hypothetical protein
MYKAFVLHGSHATLRIFYAEFPNSYLSDITQYGANYLGRTANKQKIEVRCTKKFHMSHSQERAEFFRLFAKWLYYLNSGKSHVGYLFNYDQNPIHQIVCSPVMNAHR